MAYNYGNMPGYYTPANYYQQMNNVIPQQISQQYPIIQNLQQEPKMENSFIWVQGKEAAKAYPVAPGRNLLLMDSENPFVYMKSTDISGKPQKMKVYRLVEEDEEPEQDTTESFCEEPTNKDEYVKKDDLISFATKEDYATLLSAIESLQEKITNIKTDVNVETGTNQNRGRKAGTK